jgi:hypothetical protein
LATAKKGLNVKVAVFTTIKVYNILGQLIAALINEYRLAGTYEIKFNGSNLLNGIYFYRMQAGSFVEVKKLMLIK